jgi:hypothetical protein
MCYEKKNSEPGEILQEAVLVSLWFYLGISLGGMSSTRKTSVGAVGAQLIFQSNATQMRKMRRL